MRYGSSRTVRNRAGLAAWAVVGLLVVGCTSGCATAAQPAAGGSRVVTGGGGLTPPPSATARAGTPARGAPLHAATPGGPCPTPAQWENRPAPTAVQGTPANTPEAEALSQAVGTAGREGAFADSYGSQITDFPAGRVALCVTDLAAGPRLAAAAKRIDPRIDLGRLDFYLCRYSAARLAAAARTLEPLMLKGALGFPLNSVAGSADASSVEVGTNAAGVASAAFKRHLEQLTGGIPVTLVDQGPAVAA